MRAEEEVYIARIAEAEFNGSLGAAERRELEARKAASPEFAQAYSEYYHTISSLHEGARRKHYKALLSQVHGDVVKTRKPFWKRTILFNPQQMRTAAVAASVALLSSALTVAILSQNNQKNAVSKNLQLVRHEMENIKQAQHRQQKQIEQIKVSAETTSPTPPKSNYSGTGFALSNDGYLVTNYHVVEGAESLSILTHSGKSYPARVIAYEPTNDIALLQVVDEDFSFSKRNELPYSFLPGKAALGASIYTLGFPQDEIVYNEGYISARNGYQGDSNQYRLEVPSGPGQSGAPVVDDAGNVIGIIRSKDAQTESTTYAVSSKTLLRLLRDVPKDKRPKLPVRNRMGGLSREQQIEKLQDFTCMVQVYKK